MVMEKQGDKNNWLDKINNIFKKLLASFDNHSEGFSARKLTSFATIILVAELDYSYEKYASASKDFSLFPEILMIHLLFVLIVLGIVTMEQVIKLKESNKSQPNNPEPNMP